MIYRLAILLTLGFVAGCAAPPSVPVVGAYFPDWLFCIAAGVAAAVVVRAVLIRCGIEWQVGPPAVVYPTLAVLFSLLAWLVLFKQ